MLYDVPGVYDALYDEFTEDIPFYTDLARDNPGPVCELACGTGRVSVPLALSGAEVHGFDVSEQMRTAAEARAREHKVPSGRVHFGNGDMRSPPDSGDFALVLIPLHSLSHLHTGADVRACLQGGRRTLRAGGRLAFALHNPDPAVLARDPHEVFRIHEGVSAVAVYESSRYDAAKQLLHLSWFVETADGTERFDYALRMFFPAEVLELLHCNGYVLEQRYGWYDGSAFTPESGTQILVARRD
jgi:SAM-dependent methyltransferase